MSTDKAIWQAFEHMTSIHGIYFIKTQMNHYVTLQMHARSKSVRNNDLNRRSSIGRLFSTSLADVAYLTTQGVLQQSRADNDPNLTFWKQQRLQGDGKKCNLRARLQFEH